MSNLSSRTRRSGFTLVEVAIALAIFVFGALAIVQIFPPALGVIRNNESRVIATQLGETAIAQLQSKLSQPPEAIFDVDTTITDANNPYKWQDWPAAVNGTVIKNSSLPKSPLDSDFAASALGHFRYIYGEPHYVEKSQTIFLNRPIDNSILPTAFVDYTVEGVQINEGGDLDFTHAYIPSGIPLDTAYKDPGIPFNNGGNRPPTNYRRTINPSTNSIYYVSYRWREHTDPNIIKGVIEEPLSIPADVDWTGTPARVLPCVVNSNNKVIPGVVRVRLRKSITASSSSVGGSIVSIAVPETGVYYLNYLSKDWRELTDDSTLQNNVVHLPIAGIDATSVFGVLTNSNYTRTPLPSSGPNPIASVNAKNGDVTYSFPATPAARVRTVYRALDGWAVQPSVAARSYIPYIPDERTNPNFPREPWREYYWSGDGSSNEGELYFHPGEAGKSISVSYLNDAGEVVNGAVLTINNMVRSSVPPAGFHGPGNPIVAGQAFAAAAIITDLAGNRADVKSILSVQGLSIHARTAWQNADRYNQVIVPAYRTLMQ